MNSFFDESGKFKDKDVVCFGGVASYAEHMDSFAKTWEQLLNQNGLKEFSAKDIFNARRPLSKKNSAIGVAKRIDTLLPFIRCIRKELLIVTGVAISVLAFKRLPSHTFQFYGNDPINVAFARAMLHVCEFTPQNDKISFICDDEEGKAETFLKIYRKIKQRWPDAKKKLAGISFVDGEFLFGLQAADLVAGVMRLEAGRIWHRSKYDYGPLYKALTLDPERYERLSLCDIALCSRPHLLNLANSLKSEWERVKNEAKERGI